MSADRKTESSPSYSRLSQDTEDQLYESDRSHFLKWQEAGPQLFDGRARKHFTPSIWHVLLLLITLANVALFFVNLHIQLNKDAVCMRFASFWSPVWQDVPPAYYDVVFNGTLDAPSEFRGLPSPAVDEAWRHLDGIGSVALDEETFFRAGGSPENAKVPDELGGGYMVDIEVQHQMHCLNFVRMAAYADHYRSFAPEWQDSNRTFNVHLEHCIEMIRTSLLGQADSGMIPFRWVEGYDRPMPDFSTPHRCRDWNAILGWQRDREVHIPPGYRWDHQDRPHVFLRPAWRSKPAG